LVARIVAFENVFADVYPVTHEQWLDGFKRDMDPEREVAVWEEIASALKTFTAGRPLSKEVRAEAFGLLLVRSSSGAEEALKQAKQRHLSLEESRKVVNLYRASAQPITFEGK